MNIVKVNGVWFRGQYADAVELLLQREKITVNSFDNGSWEATKQMGNFIAKIKEANIPVLVKGESLRSMVVKRQIGVSISSDGDERKEYKVAPKRNIPTMINIQ